MVRDHGSKIRRDKIAVSLPVRHRPRATPAPQIFIGLSLVGSNDGDLPQRLRGNLTVCVNPGNIEWSEKAFESGFLFPSFFFFSPFFPPFPHLDRVGPKEILPRKLCHAIKLSTPSPS